MGATCSCNDNITEDSLTPIEQEDQIEIMAKLKESKLINLHI